MIINQFFSAFNKLRICFTTSDIEILQHKNSKLRKRAFYSPNFGFFRIYKY